MKKATGTAPKLSTETSAGNEFTFYELFVTALRETYWAENHLVKTLPVMRDAATHPKLKEAIAVHLGETEEQVTRLESIFSLLSEKPIAKKCIAVEGLAKEGESIIEMTGRTGPVCDLGIIMANQKVEHYEIVAYDGLIQLADSLGLPEVTEILNKTLEEEEKSDQKLNEIALKHIVPQPSHI